MQAIQKRVQNGKYLFLVLLIFLELWGLHWILTYFSSGPLGELIGSGLIGLVAAIFIYFNGYGTIFQPSQITFSAVFKVIFGYIVLLTWYYWASQNFPQTQNNIVLEETESVLATGAEVVIYFWFSNVIAPVTEELVFRGAVMTTLADWRKYYLDVLVSAAIFAASHVVIHSQWVWTDFLAYFFGGGLVRSVMFRYSRTIYPVMIHHILWNSIIWWVFNT